MITYKRILNKEFLKNSNFTFLKKFIGNRKYFFVSSGRGGLEVSIRLLKLNKNDYVFRTINEVRQQVDEWLEDYNYYSPHDSLKNKTPMDMIAKFI